jgi:tetratricopeptide (TPR) repeat protein
MLGDNCSKGLTEHKQANYPQAIEYFNICLQNQEQPKDRVLYLRANAYRKYNDLGKALLDYDESIKLNANNPAAWFSRGAIHHKLKNYENALIDYSKALSFEPRAMGYLRRADIFYKLGKYDKAVNDFEQALGLGRTNARVNNSYAWFLVTANNNEYHDIVRARKLAEKAVSLSKRKKPAYLDTLAATYAANGLFSKALEFQREAVATANAQGDTKMEMKLRPALTAYEAGKKHYQAE